MSDEELVEAWEAARLGRAVTHREHLRIAWLLTSRHGRSEGRRRIYEGTLRNCVAMDAADRFDGALTDRWSDAIAAAMESTTAATSEEFLTEHRELLDGGLYGVPSWQQSQQ